jgi:hypothetical protein
MLFWIGVVAAASVLTLALTIVTRRPLLAGTLSVAAVTLSVGLAMRNEGGAMWAVGMMFVGMVCIPVSTITAFITWQFVRARGKDSR